MTKNVKIDSLAAALSPLACLAAALGPSSLVNLTKGYLPISEFFTFLTSTALPPGVPNFFPYFHIFNMKGPKRSP